MSEKVRPHHLERKALLMCVNRPPIRFCTTERAVRCSMPCGDRLMALGWSGGRGDRR